MHDVATSCKKYYASFSLLLLIVIYPHFSEGKQASSIAQLDTMAKMIYSLPDDTLKIKKLYNLAVKARSTSIPRSYAYGKLAFGLSQKINYKNGAAMGLIIMGIAKNYEGKDVECVELIDQALSISKEIKDHKLISECYGALFNVYYETKNIKKAKEYIQLKAASDSLFNNNTEVQASNTDMMGLIYEEDGDLNKAFECYKQAAALAENAKDSIHWSTYTNNVGIIYSYRANYDSALAYHKKSLNIKKRIGDEYVMGYVAIWVAQAYYELDNLDSALAYANFGLESSLLKGSQISRQMAYKLLYSIYKKQNNIPMALANHENYMLINDSVITNERAKAIEGVENKYKLQNKEEELNYKEQELFNKNILLTYSTILIVLIVIIAYILYNRSAVRNKLNKILSMQKAELHEKNQEIEAQNEEISAINKNLEDIIDTRTLQLRESENLLSMSQSLAKLGSWVYNCTSLTYKWSLEAFRIFEMSEYDTPNFETVLTMLASDSASAFRNRMETCINHGVPFELEFLLKTPKGDEKYIYILALPVIHPQSGEVTEVKGCVQDITDRKSSELKFIEQTNELIQSNQKAAEYKLMALRSVMNPHFLFNSLNSIQYFIAKNIKEQAINYLSQFSKLMRLILNSSVNNTITLSQEIEMLKLYVNLESLRFNNFRVIFTIEPELDIDYIEIPSLLLQPYVENAILHGLSNLEDGSGILEIAFKKENDTLACIIEDNGIGRAASMALKDKKNQIHKSVGMLVTAERINMISKDDLLAVHIIDKEDEDGNAMGTRVEIMLEID